ncbi:hypothetical protein [Pontibacillus marinus]|uniref:Sodium:proton antiporter n=1 Tax=Pontibacillus marinus BH030004 = DSM 16465 TaxID=1385511 RepID=A0A0A5G1N6_9BACI|nr:hypothetical protein [Pontibacillus marinus]KGX85023.1 hypothetical protein N783_15515 [Pontibacillus marinus BH030004 = DSM 16465]
MRMLSWIVMLGVAFFMINRYKYRILNVLLAVGVIRKVVVSITMRLPYLREKILPEILGRTAI